MNMKLRCRLSWQEDKENDRKGRKRGKPREGEKKGPLRHNPPPRYDCQWKELHSQNKQDGSQFWRHSGRNICEKVGQSLLGCWRGEVDEKCTDRSRSPFMTPWGEIGRASCRERV